MNSSQTLLVITSVLVGGQHYAAMADTVERTVSTPVNAGGVFNLFVPVTPEVVDADAFLSINGGGLSGAEGGIFTVAARFSDAPDETIFQHQFPFSGGSLSLSSIPINDFVAPASLTGLVFASNSSFTFNFTIPAGTVFSFSAPGAAIPEAASTTFWAGAVATSVFATRRRRRDALVD